MVEEHPEWVDLDELEDDLHLERHDGIKDDDEEEDETSLILVVVELTKAPELVNMRNSSSIFDIYHCIAHEVEIRYLSVKFHLIIEHFYSMTYIRGLCQHLNLRCNILIKLVIFQLPRFYSTGMKAQEVEAVCYN
uniref:Uncharacterized protein n=1 Tax=Romanomermis culicivorax TaxID=13658 RepID=A0A915K3V4_ROMCU